MYTYVHLSNSQALLLDRPYLVLGVHIWGAELVFRVSDSYLHQGLGIVMKTLDPGPKFT